MKLFQQNGGQILSILDDLIERGNMIIHMQDVIHVVEIKLTHVVKIADIIVHYFLTKYCLLTQFASLSMEIPWHDKIMILLASNLMNI